MSKIVLKNENEFEDSIKKLNNIKEEIDKILELQNKEIDKINDTRVWTSDAERALYSKYNSLKNNYTDIDDSLNNYIKFMETTLDKYRGIDTQRNTNIDDNQNELNVVTNNNIEEQ